MLEDASADLLAGLGFNTASLPDRSLQEALQAGADAGLGCVELLSFEGYRHTAGELAGRFLDQLAPAEIEALAGQVALFERIAIHAPFWDILPFAPNPATRTASRRQLLRTVAASGLIGAETVTTHVIPRTGRDLSDFRQDVVDFYRELGDVAANAGLTVTIETGYPPGIGQFASLIHEIGHPAIGANVDVGHLRGLVTEDEREAPAIVAAYNDLLARHMDSLGERIYHVHLHDVQVEGLRDHRECGSGIIDYEAIFRRLLEVGYSGMMTFELEEADAEGSLRRSRRVVVEAARDASKPRGA